LLALSLLISFPALAGKRDDQVKQDKAELENNEVWIYNDLDGALSKARAANKPLFIVYRCIP
jgi:serine protease Do